MGLRLLGWGCRNPRLQTVNNHRTSSMLHLTSDLKLRVTELKLRLQGLGFRKPKVSSLGPGLQSFGGLGSRVSELRQGGPRQERERERR